MTLFVTRLCLLNELVGGDFVVLDDVELLLQVYCLHSLELGLVEVVDCVELGRFQQLVEFLGLVS